MHMWAIAESNRNIGPISAMGNSNRVSLTGKIPWGVSVKNLEMTGILVSSFKMKNSAMAWAK